MAESPNTSLTFQWIIGILKENPNTKLMQFEHTQNIFVSEYLINTNKTLINYTCQFTTLLSLFQRGYNLDFHLP